MTDGLPADTLGARDWQIVVGLLYMASLVAAILVYIFWNVVINKRPSVRRAVRDSEALDLKMVTREAISKSLSGLITANATWSGLAFAALVIMVILSLDNIDRFSVLGRSLLFVVMGLTGSANLMWFVSLDQLLLMLSPTTDDDEFKKFYVYTFNLWIIAGTFLVSSVLLLILIVSPVVAMVLATLIVTIYICYWSILQKWSFRPRPRRS